ncbi:MAG: DnaJ domain-containing protein [Chthoniobacterales bacterium]
MTDYFALLEQPRRPWLDPEALKEIFHRQSLQAHPDARGPNERSFTELNQAYQVLRDPKRRLQHLFEIENAPRAAPAIPAELEKLFPEVARVTQQADAVLEKARHASNALARSLLKTELLRTTRTLEEMRQTLSALYEQASSAVREINHRWEVDQAREFPALHDLYLRFSYLSRWLAELDEKLLQLGNTP